MFKPIPLAPIQREPFKPIPVATGGPRFDPIPLAPVSAPLVEGEPPPARTEAAPAAAAVVAPSASVGNYGASVERWRDLARETMPPGLASRPDAARLLDKFMYVMQGESGGRDTVMHDGGTGYGLMADRITRTPVGTPAKQQLANAWRLVANNPDKWTDWGEGALYQNKPFGVLGARPYDGSGTLSTSGSGADTGPAVAASGLTASATDAAATRGTLDQLRNIPPAPFLSKPIARSAVVGDDTQTPDIDLQAPRGSLRQRGLESGAIRENALLEGIGDMASSIFKGYVRGQQGMVTTYDEAAEQQFGRPVSDLSTAERGELDDWIKSQQFNVPRSAIDIVNPTALKLEGGIGRRLPRPAKREPPAGTGEPGGPTPPTPTTDPEEIAGRLTEAIKTAKRLTPEQRTLRSEELRKRMGGFGGAFEGAKTMDEALRARGALRGEMPRVSFNAPVLAEDEWNVISRHVQTTPKLPLFQRQAALDALADLRTGTIPQPAALEKLERIFPGLASAVASKRSGGAKLWDEVVGLLGIPQAGMTFLDASGTLRQALVPGLGHPAEFWRSIRREMRVLTAKPGQAGRVAQEAHDELMKDPFISGAGDKAGYAFEEVGGHFYSARRFADPGDRAGNFTAFNNSIISTWVQKTPGMDRSQQGMATILNQVGGRIYAREAAQMWKTGVRDIEQYKALARVINHSRGFGSFRAPDLVKGVNAFFSPRYLSSRVQMFTDPFTEFAKGNHAAARLASQNLVGFVAVNAAVLELLNQTGLIDVSWNPLDTDFGKAKIGNLRVDPWAGTSPLARLVARVAATVANEAGVETGYRSPGALELVKDFLAGKLGPVPGTLAEQLGIKDRMPDDPAFLSVDNAWENFTPFLVQSVREAYENGGLGWKGGLIAGVASFLGEGTLAYETMRDARDRLAGETFGGRKYSDLSTTEQAQIDADPTVAAMKAPPTEYAQNRDRRKAEAAQRMDGIVSAWEQGELSKPLPDLLRDVKIGRYQSLEDLRKDHEADFKNLPDRKHQGTLDDYFGIGDTFLDGNINWDSTIPKREAYVASLSSEERAWLEDYIGFKAGEKTQIEKDLDAYNNRRETAGYYKAGADTQALDRQNPDIDVDTWRYYGGVIDKEKNPDPVLQSKAAVDKALALSLPGRTVKLADLSRPINETAQTVEAWKASGQMVTQLDVQLVPQLQGAMAKAMYEGKSYEQLDKDQQSNVRERIRNQAREQAPEVDAWLAYWGRYETLRTPAALVAFNAITKRYGFTPPSKDWTLKIAR